MTAEPLYDPLPDDADLFGAVEKVEAALIYLEDVALARLHRQALAEDGDPIPWEQVKAEAGL